MARFRRVTSEELVGLTESRHGLRWTSTSTATIIMSTPIGARDWGTFEGKVRTAGGRMTVEGTYKLTGGDGEYGGLTGGGKFKTVMKSETEVECSWEGSYKLAKAQAR